MNALDTAARLLAAAAAGALIGWERERSNHPAGLRTHILVALGACLVMVVSIQAALPYLGSRADPTRIAAQVVSGIGFLGAGTIMREGLTIRGLTTAASLWLVSALGLAAGAGLYIVALFTTAIALVTLMLLSRVEARMTDGSRRARISLVTLDQPGQLGKVADILGAHRLNIRQVHMEDSGEGQVELVFTVVAQRDVDVHEAVRELADTPGISRLTRE